MTGGGGLVAAAPVITPSWYMGWGPRGKGRREGRGKGGRGGEGEERRGGSPGMAWLD